MHSLQLDQRQLPAAARREVAQACRDAATGPVCEESAVLVTSEVVTNALVHGRGTVAVAVAAGGEVVRVEVGDDEPRHPQPAQAAGPDHPGDDEGGRGMLIVDLLSSAWGVSDRAGGGKNVWFEVPSQP